MGRTSYADYIQHWGQLDERVKVNPEMASFEPLRAELEVERKGLFEKMNEQSALKSKAQDMTREIEGHAARGREAATRLRDAIRAQYGRDAEKLTEYGLNVRRSTPAKAAAKAKVKGKSSGKGPNPAQTAASETDGTI
jgi:peptidoglycan hydrolase CwlO-like protein